MQHEVGRSSQLAVPVLQALELPFGATSDVQEVGQADDDCPASDNRSTDPLRAEDNEGEADNEEGHPQDCEDSVSRPTIL